MYARNMKELSVILLVGAPGSGKSTYGKNMVAANPDLVRVCPDEFRAKFGWGEGDQSVSAQAFDATRKAVGEALDDGKSVVVDACNMYRKARKDFINIAHRRHAKVYAIVFEVSKSVLLSRNAKRGQDGGRNVPEDVIDRMLSRYERPTDSEVDNVKFV